MQQLAVASVAPRSIAWLIRPSEWKRFEEIVKYNCATLGGYFNVVIPITETNQLAPHYEEFLVNYDPDLIVLAPKIDAAPFVSTSIRISPFSVVPWEAVTEFVTPNPGSSSSGTNTPVDYKEAFKEDPLKRQPLIAIANESYPDTSRLAFVACGDVRPEEPMLLEMDEELDFNSMGYREHFLQRHLKSEFEPSEVGASLLEDERVLPAPDRFRLEKLILDECKFPLVGATAILQSCCELQHNQARYSFIGLTALYKNKGREFPTSMWGQRLPAVVILVSEEFGLTEALLFWNIRASDLKVAWLSFAEIEKDLDDLSKWLDSDYRGAFYAVMDGIHSGIAFASAEENTNRLKAIVDTLQEKRRRNYPDWSVVKFDELVRYNFTRPHTKKERLTVIHEGAKCAFIPPSPDSVLRGVFATTLEWDGMVLPQNNGLISRLVSSTSVEGALHYGYKNEEQALAFIPQFRVTKDRHLRAQFNKDAPIEFYKPSFDQVLNVLFTAAGFLRVEHSSHSRYHNEFVNRSGSLEAATIYLSTQPYRELITLLEDNRDANLPGWILTNPSKRRVLNHIHILEALGKDVPTDTKDYFDTVSDILPDEIISFLEKGLLERGFVLKCRACSFSSWYPAGHLSQTFECHRCFQSQVYHMNPLWLYKLPEVIFQGLQANMHVPLLALNYLKSKSHGSFEWSPDSDVYFADKTNENKRNIDLLCLLDGKLYIGEAKSNDYIETDQFLFYNDVCKRLPLDGIVFATAKAQWGRGTLERIANLKSTFNGEIILLTKTELYSAGV